MTDRSQRTAEALAAGALAGALAGCVDAGLTAVRGPWSWGVPVVACGVMALGGALVGLVLWIGIGWTGRLWAGLGVRRPGRAWLVAGVWGSLLLGGLLVWIGALVFSARRRRGGCTGSRGRARRRWGSPEW